MIGHIPSKLNASTFSDFLYVEGITSQVEQEKEGWAVWIHSEDQLEKARALLSSYLANPADPRFRQQARQAEQLKERENEEQEEAARKCFDRRTFDRALPGGLGPVTLFLIAASAFVTILYTYRIGTNWLAILMFSEYYGGAPEILKGQVWRLITPIFFHASLLKPFGFTHLLFNGIWIYILGNALEIRRGSLWFLLFVVVVAALSNAGEFVKSGPAFGGLSGVVYGLFGYIWIKGKLDPNSDLVMPAQTVNIMLIWYFICLLNPVFNLLPGLQIANVAHTVGLLVGMAWGYLATLKTR